ncbi:hypothetical protein PVAP13_1NG198600 [Panicum virgatum]|uniref:Dienelactone hydrolase domain-containing protein n=1 Tax=Panicum virgatum TaxID=38727 RepID=A0A8T0WVE2_PANVG|nr:hypothetical protein PVAP13_1NG198600 [Panicum virgatum]
MGTAHLLRRASSAFLSSTTTGPLRPRCPLPRRLRQPRAAMATDSSAAPFQKIQIQREDTTFDAYVVGKENAPGIVVLQEWWGVDYEIKNHAIHISQLGGGYRALIPDLYRGKVALDVAEAQHLMEGLDWQGKLQSSGVPYEVHIYPGCSHAFMNTSPEALKRKKGMGLTDENQEAVDLAWSRFSAWMGRFLGSA